MRDALDQFERGQLTPLQLDKYFLTCMEGLERIRSVDLKTSRHLIAQLQRAHFLEDEVEFGSPEDAAKAVDECRQFLDSLPN